MYDFELAITSNSVPRLVRRVSFGLAFANFGDLLVSPQQCAPPSSMFHSYLITYVQLKMSAQLAWPTVSVRPAEACNYASAYSHQDKARNFKQHHSSQFVTLCDTSSTPARTTGAPTQYIGSSSSSSSSSMTSSMKRFVALEGRQMFVLLLLSSLLPAARGQTVMTSAASAPKAVCPLATKDVAAFDYRLVRAACGECWQNVTAVECLHNFQAISIAINVTIVP
jgi:hypothetical protein